MMLMYNTVSSLKVHNSVIFVSKVANNMLQLFRDTTRISHCSHYYTITLSYCVPYAYNEHTIYIPIDLD